MSVRVLYTIQRIVREPLLVEWLRCGTPPVAWEWTAERALAHQFELGEDYQADLRALEALAKAHRGYLVVLSGAPVPAEAPLVPPSQGERDLGRVRPPRVSPEAAYAALERRHLD